MRGLVIVTLLTACRSAETPPRVVDETIPVVSVDALPLAIPPSMKDMVVIPKGTSKTCRVSDEGKCAPGEVREIRTNDYAIDKYEVTVADYQECIDAGACTTPTLCNPAQRNWPLARRHPMNCVSGDQARAFCKARGKRLPFDIEWERAAAVDGIYNHRIALGLRCGQVASTVHKACRQTGTSEVGAHPLDVSDWGLLDTRGNVAEFVYKEYIPHAPYRPVVDDTGMAAIVPEGRSFELPDVLPPGSPGPTVGFRCATGVLPTGAVP